MMCGSNNECGLNKRDNDIKNYNDKCVLTIFYNNHTISIQL